MPELDNYKLKLGETITIEKNGVNWIVDCWDKNGYNCWNKFYRSEKDARKAAASMSKIRQISDQTICLCCDKLIIEHHRTNRKKYHPDCKKKMDKLSNLSTQRLRRSGIWISEKRIKF